MPKKGRLQHGGVHTARPHPRGGGGSKAPQAQGPPTPEPLGAVVLAPPAPPAIGVQPPAGSRCPPEAAAPVVVLEECEHYPFLLCGEEDRALSDEHRDAVPRVQMPWGEGGPSLPRLTCHGPLLTPALSLGPLPVSTLSLGPLLTPTLSLGPLLIKTRY